MTAIQDTGLRSWTLPDLVGTRLTSNQRPHWAARAKVTKEWRAIGHKRALEARIPRLGRARIDVQWLPPTRARHDPANAHPMIKALVDGIVSAGVLADDDSAHLDGPHVTLGPLTPVGRHMRGTAALRVTITELTPHPGGHDPVNHPEPTPATPGGR